MRRALITACAAAVLAIGSSVSAGAAGQPSPDAAAPAVPVAKALYGPKAKPPPVLGSRAGNDRAGAAAPTADAQFFYAQASQTAAAEGAFAWFTVARPTLATGEAHTLAELAVQSADRRQIVEVGWTVDRALFGDANPHLFVFHWVDGQPTCYNACGFMPYPGGDPAGMTLPAGGDAHYLTIRHFDGNWWIGHGGVRWMGYFPDSLWGGRFTQAGLTQWFGEVAAYNGRPCSDMGNGRFSSSPSAAQIYNIGLWGGPTADIGVAATHASYYTATLTSKGSMRYGGPGAC